MKRNELSVWAILIAASIVGSVVAAAIPDQAPKPTNKQVKHADQIESDKGHVPQTLVTTQPKTKSDASYARRFAAPKLL